MSRLNASHASAGSVLQCGQRCLDLPVFGVSGNMHQPFDHQMKLGQVTFRSDTLSTQLLKVYFNIFNILVNPFELCFLHRRPPLRGTFYAHGGRPVCCFQERRIIFLEVYVPSQQNKWPPWLGIFCIPSRCL